MGTVQVPSATRRRCFGAKLIDELSDRVIIAGERRSGCATVWCRRKAKPCRWAGLRLRDGRVAQIWLEAQTAVAEDFRARRLRQ